MNPPAFWRPHEIEALYQVLDKLRADGYSFVLITHKMKEVLQCADRITVLRGGRVAGTLLGKDATEERLVGMMFDKPHRHPAVSRPDLSGSPCSVSGSKPLLELKGVETHGEGAATSLKDIDLVVYPGEIVGIAGVSGNGQKELGDVVLGMERHRPGPEAAVRQGLFPPVDRRLCAKMA